jgi:hypothetical protein
LPRDTNISDVYRCTQPITSPHQTNVRDDMMGIAALNPSSCEPRLSLELRPDLISLFRRQQIIKALHGGFDLSGYHFDLTG